MKTIWLSPIDQMAPIEAVLDEADGLDHANECRCQDCQVVLASYTLQQKAVMKMARRAVKDEPLLVFRAIFEDWPVDQFRKRFHARFGTA